MINGPDMSRASAAIKLDDIQKTTKSFLHHFASFMFIIHPEEVLITTVWRTVSLGSHGTLYLRGKVSQERYDNIKYGFTVMRIIVMNTVLLLCLFHSDVRRQFARSAVGHAAYMATRFGPVYSIGAPHFTISEHELWMNGGFHEKFLFLLSGKQVLYATELLGLVFGIIFFICLRLSVIFEEVPFLTGLTSPI
jgi:hypothetical protein